MTYLKLIENSPKINNTSFDLLALIKETGNIYKVVQGDIEELHTLWAILNQDNELEPTELVEEEATHTETLLDNCGMPPLLKQFPSQS